MSSLQVNLQIDVEKLINAVKSRPPLYSRSERYESGHKNKKKRLWMEVCKEVHPTFGQLSATEIREYEREVYKRWRSLRTCFTRELALQRKERTEKFAKRRKRYEYFDALQFMRGEYGDYASSHQDDTETIQIMQFDSDEEPSDFGGLDEASRSDAGTLRVKSEIEVDDFPETEIFFDIRDPTAAMLKETHDALASVSVQTKQENDSDKLFMLSLIPSFRRIHPRKKLAAKIELMKVMQSFQDDE